jgi:hypothetical protein
LGRTEPLDNDRIYYYYSFDPSNMTGDMLSIVEADQNHHILDYPFANGIKWLTTKHHYGRIANFNDGRSLFRKIDARGIA